MGWENVFHCEMNPFGQRVLAHHFPNSKLHEDVKTFPSSDYVGRIDILTGGFPCQPYSVAGKRKGKNDDRHLWPAMLDIIQTIRPRWVVGENVRGILSWNDGLVFEEVCADLENSGYAVQPYLLPAAGVGAPHRRDRIWFIAHDIGRCKYGLHTCTNEKHGLCNGCDDGSNYEHWPIAHPEGAGIPGERITRPGQEKPNGRNSRAVPPGFEQFPTQPPICGGDDGLPRELDGITFPKWRNESIKAYGNAIVPQVAYQIFQAIQQTDDTLEQD